MNVTDLLLEIVIGLIVTVAALVAWIFLAHQRRVERKFDKNELSHKDLYKGVALVRETSVRTEAKVDHIIQHHEKMPPFE